MAADYKLLRRAMWAGRRAERRSGESNCQWHGGGWRLSARSSLGGSQRWPPTTAARYEQV